MYVWVHREREKEKEDEMDGQLMEQMFILLKRGGFWRCKDAFATGLILSLNQLLLLCFFSFSFLYSSLFFFICHFKIYMHKFKNVIKYIHYFILINKKMNYCSSQKIALVLISIYYIFNFIIFSFYLILKNEIDINNLLCIEHYIKNDK